MEPTITTPDLFMKLNHSFQRKKKEILMRRERDIKLAPMMTATLVLILTVCPAPTNIQTTLMIQSLARAKEIHLHASVTMMNGLVVLSKHGTKTPACVSSMRKSSAMH